MSLLFKVYFLSSSVHSCFFYLNDSDLRKSESKKRAIKIKFGPDHQKMTFGCISSSPLAEVPNGHIGVSSLYGYKLGFEENEIILVSYCDVDSIDSLQILPKKEEDYVILLGCKSILETHLLNQLSVVAEGQILPVYVFSNISVDIEVGKLNLSSGYGQLEKFTEITVLHPSEKAITSVKAEGQFLAEGETEKGRKNLFELLCNNLNSIIGNKVSAVQIEKQISQEIILKNVIENNRKNLQRLEFKVQPSFMLTCDVPKITQRRFIIVSNLESKNCFGPYSVKILAKVEKSLNDAKEKLENTDKDEDESMFLNTYIISLNNNNDCKIAFCPAYVMRKLKLCAGSKITITELKPCDSPSKREWPRQVNYDSELSGCFWKSIGEIRENVKQTVINNFKHNYKINTLIVGGPGTGKTYFLTDIVNEFTNEFVYCKVIQCKSLRGKKIETLHQLLTYNLKDCICQEPSLLVLDDLHALTYIAEEEEKFNRYYSDRVVDLISVLLEDFQSKYNITVIASATDLSQLSAIVSRHGPRLFQNVLQIPEMNLAERNFILGSIINHKVGVTNDYLPDLEKLSSRTNGYTVQNLTDLVDKAIFNCLLRCEREDISNLSETDFELALSESMPLNLIGVKLKQNIEISWDDVGGMAGPKKILTEVFSWPLQYPDLLESCPLRLQRGVLLYGAPGTGKTLLAGALANKCGLNFISVKGPEVLSKYVGASEEGVRSLFVQAQKTRPCLLFFDEFDSLVPKRGHDSSGVTDRVVNQMLTQLDGVESLNGVWVLAATSRPDLLDPALLRPGRLDKLVFCEVPNQVDRLSILEVLSKNLLKTEDVSLAEIAKKTEGFTGADLQAVLYNAQMSAIKGMKNSLQNKSGTQVKRIHFLCAFSKVKPSLSEMEKERYDKIYEKFLSSRKRNNPKRHLAVQKVTLA